jgi:quinoprotein glucose dehydrogenase
MTVATHNNTGGLVRAFDEERQTLGRSIRFRVPGGQQMGQRVLGINGNTGVWSQITVDGKTGLVYLPVEDPTSDYFGGHRPATTFRRQHRVRRPEDRPAQGH